MKLEGKKLKMMRIFDEGGTAVPVTVVDVSSVANIEAGDVVTVSGTSKGKGFAGVMKRWGFKGGPRTHGQSDRERAPGSIGGTTDPARVWPGKKMPGRMGGRRVTIKGLQVMKVDEEKGHLLVKGSVPGFSGGSLEIKKENDEVAEEENEA
ncbi:MAG: 50S ribosomal protein L3 [Patescibacteria group bacterium]